ncbi:uncharacterized protein TNCV_2071642 [Trichonephila clavipes]|uniref:Uncharacterized protein n=1 Tax=Trichonephila clavipes TaxID=2585209 RepID=A0A8X6W3C6_TRICX|nr:uncharacterized protein TNCV_2071642 [Trichonephila clavipes]
MLLSASDSDSFVAENERVSPAAGMSKETSPPMNKVQAKESYWFAHSGFGDAFPPNVHNDSKSGGDLKEQQVQKDKEEKIRIFRELQEEERLKRVKEMEQQFLQAKKHRELQEEERRRRIEEARVKELERRQQVEERKRQIWEAEQERKEAILRRNMEREARIEARRNAQRNSQSFAFGSSTPRTFDLDLAAIGMGRSLNAGSVLMSSVSRRSEERELGPPRATSACSLDRKFGEDCMSRSMVSLSSSTFRGRKRTDIMPTLTRERSITPHVTPRGNNCMRAVSMTRLDQLAQPRRTYRDPRSYATDTTTNQGPRTVSPSMSKSMCNLANSSAVNRRAHAPMSSKGSMARSMLHLADSPQKENSGLTPSPTLPKSGMRSAQSMMHLAVAPRLTRAARLRAEALAGSRTVSAWNLNKPESYQTSHYLSPGKDTSRSPSRPQSSMSGTSELSTASSSAVNMRPRTAPRKPRPFSVAGSIVNSSSVSAQIVKKELDRPTRQLERNVPVFAQKPPRARSVNRDNVETKTVPLTAPKKPAPPPKPLDVVAKAKSHPVPIKDNLRKRGKPANHPVSNDNKVPIEVSGKSLENLTSSETTEPKKKAEIHEVKEDFPPVDGKPNSAVTSPTTDSDMLISYSDDSRVSAVIGSDMDNTLSQSVTESELKIEESSVTSPSNSQSVSIADKNSTKEIVQNDNVAENIPSEAQQKEVKSEVSDQMQTSFSENLPKEAVPSKPRITSEEEARAALAEKRRLAREQAEREAELERQRLEEIRRQEEEQKRLEELEQKRMEEEQIRLAALHRQMEEEKLAKAIEEQQQREKEELERKEEEARQKAEKEEQERKAREEAEKQRLELEEKLRKEEEERAERKRRVEQIMARTRGKTAAQSPSNPPSDSNNFKNVENTSVNSSSFVNEVSKMNIISNGVKDLTIEKNTSLNGTSENHVSNSSSWPFSESKQVSNNNPLPDILNSENIANQSAKSNGTFIVSDEQSSKINVSNSFSVMSNRTLSANEDTSPQTNGYSSHEEMSCTTSPEENADMGLLIDIQSNQQQHNSKTLCESSDFTKLVDVDQPSLDNNVNNENYLINVDDVNSNLFNSGNPFSGFEDSLQKKQDTSVTDLLS